MLAPEATRKNIAGKRALIWAMLLGMCLVTLAVLYVVVENAVKNTIEHQAVSVAEIVAAQATTARSVYAKEIAAKLQRDGTGPHTNSAQMPGFVPIPAEFLKLVGLASTTNSADLFQYKPVSKWHLEPTQGITDDFLTWAWPQLEAQDQPMPSGPIDWKPVWRFETQKDTGKKILRYLHADPASQMGCVTCHNEHESRQEVMAQRQAANVMPGRRWQQHQLLGALSITIPLERVETVAATQIRTTSLLVFALLLPVFLVMIGFNVRAARQDRNLKATEGQLESAEKEARNANELLLAKQGIERAFTELSTYLQAIDQHALVSAIGAAGYILQVNNKFIQVSGYSREALIGKDFRVGNSCVHPKAFYDDLWAILSRGEIWQGEICSRAKSGDIYWLDSAIVPLKDNTGKIDRYISIQIDCTERKRVEQELQELNANLESRIALRTQEITATVSMLEESKKKLQSIVDTALDAVIRVDIDGTIVGWNPQAEQTFGWTAQEAVGQALHEMIIPAQHQEAHLQGMARYIATAKSHVIDRRIEISALHRTGREFPIELAITHVKLDNTTNFEFCAFIRDISQRKQAEEEIRNSLKKQKELNQLKSQFVSMASHEFRTPLTAMMSSADLLENYFDRILPAERQELFRSITHAGNRMTRMLEDILLIGQDEAERLQFNPVLLSLDVFCNQLIQELQSERSHTGNVSHRVKLSIVGDTAQGFFDEKLLRHIFGNLLTNAIKYSPDCDSVEFRIDCDDKFFVFAVTDHGIGIPEADLPMLFENFHRASNVGRIAGTGLGLAIVKRSVELHSGSISVSSVPGSGSVFTVSLPRNR